MLEFFTENFNTIQTYFEGAAQIVLGANIITMATPTKVDNKILDPILMVINWLSLNIFKNKNADA